MELIRFVPLYFTAMLQSTFTIIEVPFVTTPAHIVVSMKSRPQTLRETQLVNVHTEMPKKANKNFVGFRV